MSGQEFARARYEGTPLSAYLPYDLGQIVIQYLGFDPRISSSSSSSSSSSRSLVSSSALRSYRSFYSQPKYKKRKRR